MKLVTTTTFVLVVVDIQVLTPLSGGLAVLFGLYVSFSLRSTGKVYTYKVTVLAFSNEAHNAVGFGSDINAE